MAGLSEPIAIAIIAGVVGIITAIIGAARTASRPPAEPAAGKPSPYVVKLDDDDRDDLSRLADALVAIGKALDELRHEMRSRR